MQVTQKELADSLGLSTRRIRQLSADQGLFQVHEDKKYDLAKCVQEYIKFKVDAETSGGNDLDYWEEKAKHEEAKRKITQMKLSRMKRESFDASDVEDAWAALLLGFKEEMQALPHKLAPLLIGLDDMAEIDRILEVQMDDALLTLSQFDLEKIQNEDNLAEEDDDEEQYPQVTAGPSAPPPTSPKTNGKPVGRGKQKAARR